MEKRDLVKELKELYFPPKDRFAFVDVPELPFLAVDGDGSPETSAGFQEAIAALYSVAYTVKFALRKERGLDAKVTPLEGLFWTGAGGLPLDGEGTWHWTLLLLEPSYVTEEDVARAAEEARRKRTLPGLSRLRLERLHEGLCVQTLYLGAYADERPTIDRMHAFIAEQGVRARRQAPRDLPRRPAAHPSGATQDRDPAASPARLKTLLPQGLRRQVDARPELLLVGVSGLVRVHAGFLVQPRRAGQTLGVHVRRDLLRPASMELAERVVQKSQGQAVPTPGPPHAEGLDVPGRGVGPRLGLQ